MSISSLPYGWNYEHDIFLCWHDSHTRLDYSQISAGFHKVFPDMARFGVNERMIERRLQVLDMCDHLDYFQMDWAEVKRLCHWARGIKGVSEESRYIES